MFVIKKDYDKVIKRNLELKETVRGLQNDVVRITRQKEAAYKDVSLYRRGCEKIANDLQAISSDLNKEIANLKEKLMNANNISLEGKDLYVIHYYDSKDRVYRYFNVLTTSQRKAILCFRKHKPKNIADIEDIVVKSDIIIYEGEDDK